MSNVTEKSSKIYAYILKKGVREEAKSLSVAMLYSNYADSFGTTDKKLSGYATLILSRSILKNTKEDEEWKKLLSDLNIKKGEYPEIVKDFLNIPDKFNLFTPNSVVEFVERVLDIKNSDSVFDIGSGYGNFLIDIAAENINEAIRPSLIGQEINTDAYYISCMALDMCGANYHVQNVNSVSDVKCPSFTKGYIFPPFALKYDSFAVEPFKYLGTNLFESKASYEWLFVLKALEGMNPNGKIAVILPEGALFRTQDSNIRKYLLDNKLIEGIVSLPAGTFMPWTNIKTNLLIISHDNDSFKVIDGEEVLKDLPVRGLSSHEAAVDLANAYFAENVERIQDGDIKSLDFNLSLNALHAKDIYEGLSNLKKISDVADVFKGSPLTLSMFKDQLSNCKTQYQLLSSGNIDDGIIDYASLPFIADGKKYEKFALKKGDVVLTAKSTKVKFAVINDEPESTLIAIGGMIVIRPKQEIMDGTYLKMFLDSIKGKQILESIKKGTVILTIPFNDFLNIQIPCPEIENQKKMSAKYNRLLAMYDGMKKEVESMERRISSFYDENKED